LKSSGIFASKNFKFITLSILVVSIIFLVFFLFIKKTPEKQRREENKSDKTENNFPDIATVKAGLDTKLDSILLEFGIRKEWIATSYPNQQSKQKESKKILNELFSKTVSIPKELPSIEINIDITSYLNSTGLRSVVNEDILTKDISIDIFARDDSAGQKNLARVQLSHSDKVSRQTATCVFILSGLQEFDAKELDEIINLTSEFSYLLPKNLDDIDLQNKLINAKRNVLMEFSIASSSIEEAEFYTGMAGKDIQSKIKTFTNDFPSIKYVLLSARDKSAGALIVKKIAEAEMTRLGLKVISDSLLTETIKDDEKGEKIKLILEKIRSRTNLSSPLISKLWLDPNQLKNFYSEVLTLKKKGYKFYTLSEYLTKEEQSVKKEKLKQEEEKKKQTKEPEKKPIEKKSNVKKKK